MKNKYNLAIMAAAFTYISGGFDVIAIDYMTEYISPSVLIFLRLFVATMLLGVIVFIKERKISIEKKDLLRVFVSGAIGISFYYTLESLGIESTSGALASLILATVPIFGIVADRIFFKRKLTVTKIISVVISIVGVSFIVVGAGSTQFYGSIKGILIMFAAAIAWIIYVILVKPLNEKYSLLTILTGLFVSGTITSIPFALFGNIKAIFEIDIKIWGLIIFTAIFFFLFGQLTYVYAVGKLSVTTVSVFENVLPIVAILVSFVLFGERLKPLQLNGGLMIIISVTITALKDRER